MLQFTKKNRFTYYTHVLYYQAKLPPLLTSAAECGSTEWQYVNVQQSDLIIVAAFKSGWKSLIADS